MCQVLIALATVLTVTYGLRSNPFKEVPYLLSLQEHGFHICCASIIGATVALTAAHCVEDANPPDITLRAGSSQLEQGGTVHQVNTIHIQPQHLLGTTDYDFAVLKVAVPFSLGSPGINSIKLTKVEPTRGYCTVTGWRTSFQDGGMSAELQIAKVHIEDRLICSIRRLSLPTLRMICAGTLFADYDDSCRGDSGAPLVCNERLAGIVSWGEVCANPKYPIAYSNVNNQREWIRSIIDNKFYFYK